MQAYLGFKCGPVFWNWFNGTVRVRVVLRCFASNVVPSLFCVECGDSVFILVLTPPSQSYSESLISCVFVKADAWVDYETKKRSDITQLRKNNQSWSIKTDKKRTHPWYSLWFHPMLTYSLFISQTLASWIFIMNVWCACHWFSKCVCLFL